MNEFDKDKLPLKGQINMFDENVNCEAPFENIGFVIKPEDEVQISLLSNVVKDIAEEKSKIAYFKIIIEEMLDTYKAKNADYGDSFRKVRGEYPNAILIRLMDKLERLKKLYEKGYEPKVLESIDDTLLDLATYSVMELVERGCNDDSSN